MRCPVGPNFAQHLFHLQRHTFQAFCRFYVQETSCGILQTDPDFKSADTFSVYICSSLSKLFWTSSSPRFGCFSNNLKLRIRYTIFLAEDGRMNWIGRTPPLIASRLEPCSTAPLWTGWTHLQAPLVEIQSAEMKMFHRFHWYRPLKFFIPA